MIFCYARQNCESLQLLAYDLGKDGCILARKGEDSKLGTDFPKDENRQMFGW